MMRTSVINGNIVIQQCKISHLWTEFIPLRNIPVFTISNVIMCYFRFPRLQYWLNSSHLVKYIFKF